MKKLALLSLVTTAFLWGTGFLFTKDLLNRGMGPLTINFLRFLIAAIVLWAVFFRSIVKSSYDTYKKGIIMGMFLFLGFFFQTIGMQETSVSNASFITTTNIVWVALFSYLFYQGKMGFRKIIGTVLTMGGLYLLTVTDGFTSLNKGDMYILLCAFMFAWHIVLTTKLGNGEDARVLTSIQMLVAATLSFLALILFDQKGLNISSMQSIDYVTLIYLGIFPTLMAFFLQTWGQKKVQEHTASLILSLEAVFASVLAWLILGEIITFKMLMGMTMIVLSILVIEAKTKKEEPHV